MGYLVEVRERGKSSRRLVVDDRVEVGRTAADVRVEDTQVSRRHLLLTVTSAGLAVLDLGSSNGTTVNGASVAEATVRPGHVIGLGQSEIEVICVAGDPQQQGPAGWTESLPPWRTELAASADPDQFASAMRQRLGEGFQERETQAAVFRYRPGTASEHMLPRLVPAVTQARRHLAGLGSEPWGVWPMICLVDPFPDPHRSGQLITAGTVVDTDTGEIWMVVTVEGPPEPVERPLALFFGAALPAADDLALLLEGYGLALAEVESPDVDLGSRPLPPLTVADGELRSVMALSFVRYLIEKNGRPALLRMLSSAVPGRVDAAAAAVYGVGLAALEQQWRATLSAEWAPRRLLPSDRSVRASPHCRSCSCAATT